MFFKVIYDMIIFIFWILIEGVCDSCYSVSVIDNVWSVILFKII